jgi:hypothetical protein
MVFLNATGDADGIVTRGIQPVVENTAGRIVAVAKVDVSIFTDVEDVGEVQAAGSGVAAGE